MTRAEVLVVCTGLGIAILTYFGTEFVIWRAYYAIECEKMFSPACIELLHFKHLVAAVLPAYLTGRWIGRRGMALGAVVSLGGWFMVNFLQPILGPNSFDAWHLVGNYVVLGALAGGIGQFHRPLAGNREL